MQIIVMGMHRSGTSAVARVLNLCGAYFGPESVATEPLPQNPKGFWERRDVRALCDEALQLLDIEWWSPSKLDLSADPAGRSDLAERFGQLLHSELTPHEPYLLKEPRLCLMFPIVREQFDNPVVVHVVRDPLEVARSLQTRNGFSIPMGLALWEFYRRSALQAAQGLPSVTVEYHALIANPVKTAQQLCAELRQLGVSELEPDVPAIEDFVEESLHRSRAASGEHDYHLTQSQLALWQDTTGASAAPVSDALREHLRSCEDVVRKLNAADRTLAKTKQSVSELKTEMVNARARAQEAVKLKDKVVQLTSELDREEHRARQARQQAQSAEAEAKLAKRTVGELRLRVESTQNAHDSLKAQIKARERDLKDLRRQLGKSRADIQKMQEQRAVLRKRIELRREEVATLRGLPLVPSMMSARKTLHRLRRAAVVAKKTAIGWMPGTAATSNPGPHSPASSHPMQAHEAPADPSLADAQSTFERLLRPVLEQPSSEPFRATLAENERALENLLSTHLIQPPLVSVIMPAYNRADIVGDALSSILEQSYQNFEVVVCDDGSEDGTLETLKQWANKDPRIKVIQGAHGGAAKARNTALAQSSGQLIAYLDTDNVWHRHYLRAMVTSLARSKGSLAAYARYVDLEIRPNRSTITNARAIDFDYEALTDKNYIDLNSFMHDRVLYERLGGFDPSLERQQDWDLTLRYTFLQDPLQVEYFLTLYRRNKDWHQITHVQRENRAPMERIQRKLASYYNGPGLPYIPAADAPSVSVVSWDICRNHFSKAYSVAEILSHDHDVQLVGFDFFDEGVFGPFKDEHPKFDTRYLPGKAFPDFNESLYQAVNALHGNVSYCVKPRLASLGVGLLANYHKGTPLILEHNDLESVVALPKAGDSDAELRPADVDLRDPDLDNPYGVTWTRLMQYFAQRVPVSVTHNRNLNNFFGNRSYLVRNPKDEEFFDPDRYDRHRVRSELGVHEDDRLVLFGGTLREHKGIEAIAALTEKLGAPYKVLFVSSRDAGPQLKFREKVENERVVFLEAQNRNAMAKFNLAADVTILWLDPKVPASHYQMPYKLTDALAMRLPVVASEVSDLVDLADSGVLRLCPYGDFDRLRQVLDNIFNDTDSTLAMAARGRRLYLRQFSYRALQRTLPIVLEKALEQQGTLEVAVEFAEFFGQFYESRRLKAAF